jgi:biopolymer transport protein ExbB/TolQ
MDILERASEFEARKWSGITTSDRIKASRDIKQLILDINEVYKRNRDQSLMEIMKRLTAIKRKLEARLNGGLEI